MASKMSEPMPHFFEAKPTPEDLARVRAERAELLAAMRPAAIASRRRQAVLSWWATGATLTETAHAARCTRYFARCILATEGFLDRPLLDPADVRAVCHHLGFPGSERRRWRPAAETAPLPRLKDTRAALRRSRKVRFGR